MKFFLKVLVSAIAIFITAYLLPGVSVAPFSTAIVVAFVLAVLNALLRPVLIVLTIPVTIMSLGLFLLVINAFIIQIAAYVVRGFDVVNFWWALLFSVILTIVTWVLEMPVRRPHGHQETRHNSNRHSY
jgi:putative membrane protein